MAELLFLLACQGASQRYALAGPGYKTMMISIEDNPGRRSAAKGRRGRRSIAKPPIRLAVSLAALVGQLPTPTVARRAQSAALISNSPVIKYPAHAHAALSAWCPAVLSSLQLEARVSFVHLPKLPVSLMVAVSPSALFPLRDCSASGSSFGA